MSKQIKTVDDYEFYIVGNELFVRPDLVREDLNAKLAGALSVKKWAIMAKHGSLFGRGGYTCGLCRQGGCENCIVYAVTGQPLCNGTPYKAYYTKTFTLSINAKAEAKAEHQFLLALQSGGVKAGREWLAEWRKAREKENS